MDYQNQVAIIIPSLKPDNKMLQLIGNLAEAGFQKILVVNDGSGKKYDHFFHSAEKVKGCVVIKHAINMGKGRALKDAFNYILNHWEDCIGAVTVDADGQHSVSDTVSCAQALLNHPECMIMGCRSFSTDNIPKRNKFGNTLTCKVLSFLCGIRVSDTQTGLRGLSRETMEMFLSIPGERYEYEMNTLIVTREKSIKIMEVPIETIYIEENKSSHFNPLTDSLKIYALFLKYLFTGLSSFALDIILFTILVHLLKTVQPAYYIVISTVVARITSSIFNFLMNKNNVFTCNTNTKNVFIKYYILCIVQMGISAGGVEALFYVFKINESIIKMIVDTFLFFLSYQIQMKWVFKEK